MDRKCPLVFVQVADFYGFKPVKVKLIVECENSIRNKQEKS